MTLSDLRIKQSCRIVGYTITNKRLLAMGLTRGVEVRIIRVAPLGDPIELKVRSYSLTIRKKEAETILVELLGD